MMRGDVHCHAIFDWVHLILVGFVFSYGFVASAAKSSFLQSNDIEFISVDSLQKDSDAIQTIQ